jgi:small subunit ribosomal protein S20
MANHKSALKRMRQNDKQRLLNRLHRGRMRTQIKKFRVAVASGDVGVATAELDKAISLVDRTRTKGVIHRNTAARTVSRLQTAFNKMQQPEA